MTLAERLPQGALTWGHDHWTVEIEFAALSVEMLDAVKRQVAASAGSKKVKRQEPLHIPRPAYLQKKSGKGRRIKSAGDFVAFARGIGGKK